MDELYAFENDVVETIIAYSPQDAVKVWEETVGEDYPIENGEFVKVPDEREYTLYEEELINPEPEPQNAVHVKKDEFSHTYRATVRAWIEARGRCYLGSTEY